MFQRLFDRILLRVAEGMLSLVSVASASERFAWWCAEVLALLVAALMRLERTLIGRCTATC
jgi:hypothetical protein